MKELVHDHPLSPLNLSRIPCGLNPHSSIFSPLASPSLSSPHLAFPNPSLLLAGQACLSNFLPHGYFRNHRLSTTQTLLSYWRCCRCSTPWPGSWTAGPRTPINPKSNESQSSGHDSASRPQSQTDCQVQTREGSHFSSLANSIMPSLLGTLPRPPVLTCSSHISSTSLWTVFEDRQSTHSFESFFTPWLHWHLSSTEVKLLSFEVVQSLSHVQLCDPVYCSTPGFPVLHYLLAFAQGHVHWVTDAIQPSHPLLPPSPPALNHSQNQGIFQWVGPSHQVPKYWSFSFSPSSEYSGLISFRINRSQD